MPGAAFPQRAHALGEASLLAKTRFPSQRTIPRTDFRKLKKRCARSGGASRARFRSVGLTLGVSVAAVSVNVSGRNVVPVPKSVVFTKIL